MWRGWMPTAARWRPRAKRGPATSCSSVTLDLDSYVAEAKTPSLQASASNRVQQIAQWTIDKPSNTDTEIFDLWHRRFVKSLTIIQPEMKIKKQTISPTWTTIATLKTKMNENESSWF
ncbi:hypothetical protein HMPREF1544_08394 [Mucor circinelloides 1006PhL]|uniref:Uncharacterized protein n=1 Tax=Mucor circinelloides f. circinelloides (strain 1006PhL) TaxID=1220926 RepID=S2J5B3_MUCC1|nr:hypothetical protein HMPREF1544_08394 [Mucor circinelloides 1006PhL]